MKKYIAVAGNIGVGKSTLVKMLCEYFDWEPFYEPVTENPYLKDFYEDMKTWSFHSQVYFITQRLRAHRNLIDYPYSVIQDRTVYEDAEIFARNLYREGNFEQRDFDSYNEIYQLLSDMLPPPDLVIYLRATVDTLKQRINQRGRDFELQISMEYLENLNVLYTEWIENFQLCPVLTVPADTLDFVAYNGHFQLIADKVEEKLMGKEEVVFTKEEMARY